MKKFILINLFIINIYAESCLNLIDSSKCLEKKINNNELIEFGNYNINQDIYINNSININFNNIIFNTNNSLIINADNITIKNLTLNKINGKFENYGWNNNIKGIYINHHKNINFLNLNIYNFNQGIEINNSDTIFVDNINLNNLGKSGISCHYSDNININNSYIQNILGNYNNTTDINNSKFADGVYLLSCNNVNLYNNLFNNIIRIGIALEGEINQDKSPKFIGSKVKIYNNKFFLMQQSRGTEHNAGIWIEPTENNTNFIAKYINIDIENNKIDNLNSIIGNHYQYGIFNGGNNVIIKNNQITNYINKNSIGIKCLLDCSKTTNNYFINNNIAYSINQFLNKQEIIQDKKYELLDNQNSYTNNLYNKLFFD